MPVRLPFRQLLVPQPAPRAATASVVQRLAAVSLSSSARLAVPRQLPSSSGASFLDLDRDLGSPRPNRRGVLNEPAPARGSGSTPSIFGSRAPGNDASSSFYPPGTSQSAALSRVLFDSEARVRMSQQREDRKRTTLEKMAERKVSDDYARQMPRKWRVGDLYAPHDLSAPEAAKWRRPARHRTDVMDVLGINPLDEYRNFALISEFVTPLGRIKHSSETGLRAVNQRRLAKAIRRAIGLGLHPSVHRHPEILASEISNLPRQTYATRDNRRSQF